jgi:hypothetical protein
MPWFRIIYTSNLCRCQRGTQAPGSENVTVLHGSVGKRTQARPTSLLKRCGWTSDVQAQAYGSAPERRRRPRSHDGALFASAAHFQSPV